MKRASVSSVADGIDRMSRSTADDDGGSPSLYQARRVVRHRQISQPLRARVGENAGVPRMCRRKGNRKGQIMTIQHGSQPTANSVGKDSKPVYVEPLTTREKEVLALVALGCTNAQIADLLFITEATVRNHLNNIYSKLGIQATGKSARIEAALMAGMLLYNGPKQQ
jgi:DNA-binding CsgD family transcriptional regulator